VIPERIHIQGTSRVLRSETRDRLHSEIEAIVRAQCKVAGCEGKLTFGGGFPPTLNHEIAEKKVIQAAEKLLGHSQVDYPFPPSLAAEDFAYFGEQVPSCFVFLGTRNEARGLTRHCHDPRFDIDESALAIGAALLTQIVFDSV
jgi:metal-dependent amidase/aminoacylase/carboxypeptidase family protein